MSGLLGEEEFHKERQRHFAEDVESPLIKIQMKDIFLNLLQSLRRKSFKLTTWTLLVIMNILIHQRNLLNMLLLIGLAERKRAWI